MPPKLGEMIREMFDAKVSMCKVVAVGLWVCAVWCVLLDVWQAGEWMGRLGLIASAAAATVQIRGFICDQAHNYRSAYELGRDAGRIEAEAQIPLQRVH